MYGNHEYLVLKLVEQRLADARAAARDAHAVRVAAPARRLRVQVVVRGRRRVLFRLAF
jgi:hypothetical protein